MNKIIAAVPDRETLQTLFTAAAQLFQKSMFFVVGHLFVYASPQYKHMY